MSYVDMKKCHQIKYHFLTKATEWRKPRSHFRKSHKQPACSVSFFLNRPVFVTRFVISACSRTSVTLKHASLHFFDYPLFADVKCRQVIQPVEVYVHYVVQLNIPYCCAKNRKLRTQSLLPVKVHLTKHQIQIRNVVVLLCYIPTKAHHAGVVPSISYKFSSLISSEIS